MKHNDLHDCRSRAAQHNIQQHREQTKKYQSKPFYFPYYICCIVSILNAVEIANAQDIPVHVISPSSASNLNHYMFSSESETSSSNNNVTFSPSFSYRQDVCDRHRLYDDGVLELRNALSGLDIHPLMRAGNLMPLLYDNENDVYRIDPNDPGMHVLLFDEIARRAGFRWRNSFGVFMGEYNDYENVTTTDVLLWGIDKFDVFVNWWSHSQNRLNEGIIFPEGWMDGSLILVGAYLPQDISLWTWLEPFDAQVWATIVATLVLSWLAYLFIEFADVGNNDNNEEDNKDENSNGTATARTSSTSAVSFAVKDNKKNNDDKENNNNAVQKWWKEGDSGEYLYMSIMVFTGHFLFEPKRNLSKLFSASFAIWSLLIVATYTANLTNNFVNTSMKTFTIHSIEDAIQQDKAICVWKNVYDDAYITENYPKANLIRLETEEEVYMGVIHGTCAVAVTSISSYNRLIRDNSINSECSLTSVGRIIEFTHAGVALKSDAGKYCTSLIRDVLNVHLVEMKADGFIDRTWDKELSKFQDTNCDKEAYNSNSFQHSAGRLGIYEFGGTFFLHGLLTFIAIAACRFQNYYKTHVGNRQYYQSDGRPRLRKSVFCRHLKLPPSAYLDYDPDDEKDNYYGEKDKYYGEKDEKKEEELPDIIVEEEEDTAITKSMTRNWSSVKSNQTFSDFYTTSHGGSIRNNSNNNPNNHDYLSLQYELEDYRQQEAKQNQIIEKMNKQMEKQAEQLLMQEEHIMNQMEQIKLQALQIEQYQKETEKQKYLMQQLSHIMLSSSSAVNGNEESEDNSNPNRTDICNSNNDSNGINDTTLESNDSKNNTIRSIDGCNSSTNVADKSPADDVLRTGVRNSDNMLEINSSNSGGSSDSRHVFDKASHDDVPRTEGSSNENMLESNDSNNNSEGSGDNYDNNSFIFDTSPHDDALTTDVSNTDTMQKLSDIIPSPSATVPATNNENDNSNNNIVLGTEVCNNNDNINDNVLDSNDSNNNSNGGSDNVFGKSSHHDVVLRTDVSHSDSVLEGSDSNNNSDGGSNSCIGSANVCEKPSNDDVLQPEVNNNDDDISLKNNMVENDDSTSNINIDFDNEW